MIRFSMLTDLGNYLRVRGEYSMTVTDQFAQAELPPRTRRIHMVAKLFLVHQGTTSAYAENTFLAVTISWNDANYLRVRGEYILSGIAYSVEEELPPRTRRIPRNAAMTSSHAGTTSAYAENTSVCARGQSGAGNYLRVRGEYAVGSDHDSVGLELPPRTRRIHQLSNQIADIYGTTSAYAENTGLPRRQTPQPWNYLRVRGEYKPRAWAWAPWPELPPRTRRIRRVERCHGWEIGTTSAYAENTRITGLLRTFNRNYLRVRGEYASLQGNPYPHQELPPRTRRIQYQQSDSTTD